MMFRTLLLVLAFLSFPLYPVAQEIDLPRHMAPHEWDLIPAYKASRAALDRDIITAPPVPVRTMGEWEEVQTLCITWRSYPVILKQIVRHAKEECEVLIVCASSGTNSQSSVTNYLLSNNGGGPPLTDLDNITFLTAPSNSIWIRDYFAETMYFNEVDSLVLLDWIYNRPRPADDDLSNVIGNFKNIAVFSMTQAPNDLVHTGGNFMADGFGTGFSSLLVDEENGPSGSFNQTVKTSAGVDALMEDWMGIASYVKMEELPFDNISHIDMHMKLLDEERLLVGEFPTGVSDGPQLEENIEFIQDNFVSVFGTPYEILRIPMVPSTGGAWPPQGFYRTFANAIFINKLILVPTYREEVDTTGLRLWREYMPGYKVVGIDCDNSDANIISASGAIHCITKTIGVPDPLLIRHQRLRDVTADLPGYPVEAYIRHKSGVETAEVRWTTDTLQEYTSTPMTLLGNDTWTATIPQQPEGSEVFYHIHATAFSGKQMVRPLVAPEGSWRFEVLPSVVPTLPLAIKVQLEGPWDGNAQLMHDDLRQAGLLPLIEPYSAMGFEMIGGIGATTTQQVLDVTGADAIVDWLLVELRDAVDPAVIVATQVALLQRDGDVVAMDGSGPVLFQLAGGAYHVAVRHRNHLGCMTAMPLSLGEAPTAWDLSLPATAVYGTDARRITDGVALLWAGDALKDEVIKYTGPGNDRDALLQAVGGSVPTATASGYAPGDINMDGVVKYTGADNDRDRVLQSVGGAAPTSTREGQLP